MTAISAYRLRIDGMHCTACALKIENAMKRLPGVTDVDVNHAAGTLSLQLDEDRTSPRVIERKLRSLGFRSTGGTVSDHGTGATAKRAPQAWWKSSKGQLLIGTGGLFAGAFLLASVMPGWERGLYSAVALISIAPFARRAAAAAMAGSPFTIETLMTTAALGALVIGEAKQAAVVILLFALGELLETIAAGRARAGIEALVGLVPRTARRQRGPFFNLEEVAVEQLAIGDLVVVRAGDRVPSDGMVVDGSSEVSEAPVTGESIPVPKAPGDRVYAGSINTREKLRVSITHVADDNTIARIVHLVEEAQDARAPLARLIDRFTRWYTPGAMVVALAVILIPPLAFDGDWETWIYRGLATLLIACPCALVISTPAAVASGLAAGARQGLLIKGGAALETLGKVRTVAFGKTGTLTRGAPRLTDVVAFVGDERAVLSRAAAVEQNVNHPIGQAIVEAAQARGLERPAIFGVATVLPGKAAIARLEGSIACVGSPRFAAEQTILPSEVAARIAALESEGKTVVVVLAGRQVEGILALREEPREDAIEGVRRLKERGIEVVMLSGDNARTADAIAGQLGVTALAELLPDAKLTEIARLREAGPIAMIGDGINDAPALAAASVGVAMGSGANVALETADAALLKNRVTGVAELIALSRATLGNIWQNIALAIGLKAVFLVTTLLGMTTLWMAILADTGATVLVTANALRLLAYRSPQ